MTTERLAFTKGHGTGNDFVLIADPEDDLTVTPEAVRAICDRRFGIGGDGLIRVVPAAGRDVWFMDYHNADGSIGEMCGNGARVFAAFLRAGKLEDSDEFTVATRGGDRQVTIRDEAISVDMGRPRSDPAGVQVRSGGHIWSGQAVFMPNPHAVVFVDDLSAPGALTEPPEVESTAFPDGVNVEFVVVARPGEHVAMRVHERGVGETQSCGTGICAVADRSFEAAAVEGPATIRVDVPGGSLTVERTVRESLVLTGPAELVADGYLSTELSGRLHG